MRRLGPLVLVALSALAVAGCSGADAQRAQELLQQSDQALQALKSYHFAGRLWVESDAGDVTLVMRGGGNTRRGGASFVTMRAEGIPGFPEVTVVQQARTLWIRTGGAWTRTQSPPGRPGGLDQFDLGPYVTDVSVDEDAVVNGEAADKVTGVLDTTAMFESLLSGLGGTPPTGSVQLDQVAEALGDTRVVLYISKTTHLPVRTLVDMSIEAEGEKADLHLDFALEPAQRPVRIPVPTA